MARPFQKQDLDDVTLAIEAPIVQAMVARRELIARCSSHMCKYYQKGNCHRGEQCPYRHSHTEKNVVCKHWLRGLCKKQDHCEFLHIYDLTKMPTCHFFLTFGKCNNPECLFLHEKPEERVKECPWYARGFCKHGSRCRNRHTRRLACPHYLAGFCPDGPDCKLGHPKHEMPADDGDKAAALSKHRSIVCLRCNEKGHIASQCPKQLDPATSKKRGSFRSLQDVQCFKCGGYGHYANVCPNPRAPQPASGYHIPGTSRIAVDSRLKREAQGVGYQDQSPTQQPQQLQQPSPQHQLQQQQRSQFQQFNDSRQSQPGPATGHFAGGGGEGGGVGVGVGVGGGGGPAAHPQFQQHFRAAAGVGPAPGSGSGPGGSGTSNRPMTDASGSVAPMEMMPTYR